MHLRRWPCFPDFHNRHKLSYVRLSSFKTESGRQNQALVASYGQPIVHNRPRRAGYDLDNGRLRTGLANSVLLRRFDGDITLDKLGLLGFVVTVIARWIVYHGPLAFSIQSNVSGPQITMQ